MNDCLCHVESNGFCTIFTALGFHDMQAVKINNFCKSIKIHVIGNDVINVLKVSFFDNIWGSK